MIRTYTNQGSGGTAYSKLQVSDDGFLSEKTGQLNFLVIGEKGAPYRSVVLDAEQQADLRQWLNERALSPVSVAPPKVIVEP